MANKTSRHQSIPTESGHPADAKERSSSTTFWQWRRGEIPGQKPNGDGHTSNGLEAGEWKRLREFDAAKPCSQKWLVWAISGLSVKVLLELGRQLLV